MKSIYAYANNNVEQRLQKLAFSVNCEHVIGKKKFLIKAAYGSGWMVV